MCTLPQLRSVVFELASLTCFTNEQSLSQSTISLYGNGTIDSTYSVTFGRFWSHSVIKHIHYVPLCTPHHTKLFSYWHSIFGMSWGRDGIRKRRIQHALSFQRQQRNRATHSGQKMNSQNKKAVTNTGKRINNCVSGWWTIRDSNSRPLRCERSALPAELIARKCLFRQALCHFNIDFWFV